MAVTKKQKIVLTSMTCENFIIKTLTHTGTNVPYVNYWVNVHPSFRIWLREKGGGTLPQNSNDPGLLNPFPTLAGMLI